MKNLIKACDWNTCQNYTKDLAAQCGSGRGSLGLNWLISFLFLQLTWCLKYVTCSNPASLSSLYHHCWAIVISLIRSTSLRIPQCSIASQMSATSCRKSLQHSRLWPNPKFPFPSSHKIIFKSQHYLRPAPTTKGFSVKIIKGLS